MIRSSLYGLLGLISVATVGALPLACQEGGVGDPCTPEDEYESGFAGFKVTEENIESRSFQCSTRICLVNHFQGRVTCPLGQPATDDPTSNRKSCDPNGAKCPDGSNCVEATTLAQECTPPAKQGDPNPCAGTPGTTCDANKHICVCTPGGIVPEGFFCGKAVAGDAKSANILKQFVCHTPGNCQQGGLKDPVNGNLDKDKNPKDCCIPGSDIPVVAPVCGQCDAKSNRNADQAVYCSCRCGVAEGDTPDPNFNYCACPTGFSCSEIRRNVGLGDSQITGKYCIKEGSEFNGDALSCGSVKGHFDPITCRGSQAL
ncbi:MAG: hypothetical protein ABI193_23980 [Minicystis sp.]